MTTVAILGAGEIGGAAAYALAAGECTRRVVLIDGADTVARGKALDIQQSGAVSGFHTLLEGTADLTRVVGCDLCIVADRHGTGDRPPDETLLAMKQIAGYLGDAPIVFAGANDARLLAVTAEEGAVPPRRLIGSAPHALGSAVRAIVAMEARCSPADVMLTVLGTPPAGLIVPWSEASIGGYALQQVLPQVTLSRIDARVKALWPPGPYALGTAAAQVAAAILGSSRCLFSVVTQLQGEFGVRRRPGIVPARLTAGGIEEIHVPELTSRERVLVQTALGG